MSGYSRLYNHSKILFFYAHVKSWGCDIWWVGWGSWQSYPNSFIFLGFNWFELINAIFFFFYMIWELIKILIYLIQIFKEKICNWNTSSWSKICQNLHVPSSTREGFFEICIIKRELFDKGRPGKKKKKGKYYPKQKVYLILCKV